MQKRILLAPNSFKECADSVTVASYFTEELDNINFCKNILLPLSDGGDGFLEVCNKYYNLEVLQYEISTPYDMSTFQCKVGYNKLKEIMYVESADVLGLKIIPPDKRHPLLLSSKGLGDLFKYILQDVEDGKLKVRKIIIGIGGTGTNDLGLGVLEPFGLKLMDKSGNILNLIPTEFQFACALAWSKLDLPFEIEMICDVNNPLLGFNGATYEFGMQKGLTADELEIAENGFANIVKILEKNNMAELSKDLPGAGGGLAAGLKMFVNAKIKSAKEFISEIINLNNMESVDLIITGEGAFDNQSLNQKAVGYLINKFSKFDKPIIVCCGKFDSKISTQLPEKVFVIELRKFFRNEKESIKYFRKGIHLAVKEIAERFLN